MRQRWVARWTKAGLPYEYHFTSLSSRVIARIDFGLKLMDLGYSPPNEFELDEYTLQGELQWNYPTLIHEP